MIELLNKMENLQVVGLIYDIAGVLALASPIVFRGAKTISLLSATRFNGNTELMRDLITTRLDTFFSGFLLLTGFALQVVPMLVERFWPQCSGPFLLLFLFMAFSLYYCFRPSLIDARVDRQRRQKEEKEKEYQAQMERRRREQEEANVRASE